MRRTLHWLEFTFAGRATVLVFFVLLAAVVIAVRFA
jgi:hypothetical protein